MTKGQKIFLGASIIGVLLGVPLLLWAQGAGECCRLSQDITVKDFTWGCPDLTGTKMASGSYFPTASKPNFCDSIANSQQDCAYVTTTTFKKNTVIGGGDCDGSSANKCTLKGETATIEIESQEWGTICLLNAIYNAVSYTHLTLPTTERV